MRLALRSDSDKRLIHPIEWDWGSLVAHWRHKIRTSGAIARPVVGLFEVLVCRAGAICRMSELQQHVAGLPLWTGTARIEPLLGGLSNISFTVTDATGKYVVRTGRDFPFHHVFRDREVMTARAAHAAGFAPEIVYDEPGLMVSRFIEGKVLTADDVRGDLERVARLIRHFHDEMPGRVTGPAFIFWVFHVVRDYANTLKASRNPLAARLPDLLVINERLEAVQTALRVKFGHNDLLPANLIDDGTRLWLIDFEYAGFNTAMFDFAGLTSNAQASGKDRRSCLAAARHFVHQRRRLIGGGEQSVQIADRWPAAIVAKPGRWQ